MRTGFPTPISVLTATALTLHFCGCADASCLPQYRSSSVMHTACKPRPGNCVLVKSGLSAAEKQALLDAHNNYRSRIAKGQLGRFPPAKNMLRMMWDDEMANNAQALTELCENDHDKQQERFTTKFQQTGQNIGWSTDYQERQDLQAPTWVDDWVEEYKDYAGSVSSFSLSGGRVVTHFVQIAWATTSYVGCGYVQHRLDHSSYRSIVICNYGEWGNQIGQPIYLEGATCSQCPPGSACDQRSGLCIAAGDTGGVGSGGGHQRPDHRPDHQRPDHQRPDHRPDHQRPDHRPDHQRPNHQRPDHRPDHRRPDHRPDHRRPDRQRPDHRPDHQRPDHRLDHRRPDRQRPDHGGGGQRPDWGDGGRRPDWGSGGRRPGGDGSLPGGGDGYPDGGGGREPTPSGGDSGGGHDDTREGHAGEVYEQGSFLGISYADISWVALGFIVGTVLGASIVAAIMRIRARRSEDAPAAGAAGDGNETGLASGMSSTVS